MAPEFEQAEDFFVGQVKPQLFQGREGQGNQDFNNEPEHGGIDQSSGQAGQARTRRGRMALFSREHFDEQNAVPTMEPITGMDMALFFSCRRWSA